MILHKVIYIWMGNLGLLLLKFHKLIIRYRKIYMSLSQKFDPAKTLISHTYGSPRYIFKNKTLTDAYDTIVCSKYRY